jgi:hypothetical protein
MRPAHTARDENATGGTLSLSLAILAEKVDLGRIGEHAIPRCRRASGRSAEPINDSSRGGIIQIETRKSADVNTEREVLGSATHTSAEKPKDQVLSYCFHYLSVHRCRSQVVSNKNELLATWTKQGPYGRNLK